MDNQIKNSEDVIRNHYAEMLVRDCKIEWEIEKELLFESNPRKIEKLKKKLVTIRRDISSRLKGAREHGRCSKLGRTTR